MSHTADPQVASAHRWRALVPNERILLIRPSAVGDVLMVLPSLEALRRAYPQAHIGFIVEDRAQDLIIGHPALNRVHVFPRRRWVRTRSRPALWRETCREIAAFIRSMRDERYDACVDFQGNVKGALLGLASGVPRRIGYSSVYARECNHWFTNVHVTPKPSDYHRAEKFFALVRFLGAVPEDAAYRLPPSPDSAVRVRRFLEESGVSSYAVIHPGTSHFGRAKRWPPERFATVAARLAGLGLRAVIAWGPGERQLAARVVAQSGGNGVIALETQSVLDLAELMRRAQVFIGCDSGPMHLSSAVRTPCVAIFGPFDPAVYGPYRHPCFRAVQTPPGGQGRTDAITVEQVMEAVVGLLSDGPACSQTASRTSPAAQ
jgi:heptosyltransferase-1